MTTDLIPVCVGACLCPGAPHADGDFVYLRPKLGLAAGIAVQKLVIDANKAIEPLSAAELTGLLAEGYLLHGIASWNLIGERDAIPVNPQTIKAHLLDDFERSQAAADAADDLYMTAVIAPLLRRASISSLDTSSNGLTSAHGNGARKPRKRSKQSSTTTSPMEDTATTSA
jgi:hypothetical protein